MYIYIYVYIYILYIYICISISWSIKHQVSPPRHIQLHRFLRPVQQPQRPLPVARAGAQRGGEGDAVHVFREEGDGLDDEIVVFGLF